MDVYIIISKNFKDAVDTVNWYKNRYLGSGYIVSSQIYAVNKVLEYKMYNSKKDSSVYIKWVSCDDKENCLNLINLYKDSLEEVNIDKTTVSYEFIEDLLKLVNKDKVYLRTMNDKYKEYTVSDMIDMLRKIKLVYGDLELYNIDGDKFISSVCVNEYDGNVELS